MPISFTSGRVLATVVGLRAECESVCRRNAAEAQAIMRRNAAWNDRNGPSVTGKNARQSLTATVLPADQSADGTTITLVMYSDRATPRPWRSFAHAPVGMFLELGTKHMKSQERGFTVIGPTLESTAAQIKYDLQQVMKGG